MAEEPDAIAPEQEVPAPMPAADGYIRVVSPAEWKQIHGESYQDSLRRQQRAFEDRGDRDAYAPYVRLEDLDDEEPDWSY